MSVLKIGVFTRYNKIKRLYDGRHGSPCKIFKILDHLKDIVDCEYTFNSYSEEYDFAIVDRIKPCLLYTSDAADE